MEYSSEYGATLGDYEGYFDNTSDHKSFDIESSWAWNLTVVILLSVFGIVANAALLLVIVFDGHLHTASNILIGNLAVADLVLFIFSVPSDLIHWIVFNWPDTGLGQFLCKLSASTWVMAQVLCIASLVAVSIERYCSVRRGLQLRRPRTVAVLVALWVASALFTVPVFAWSRVVRYDQHFSICHVLPSQLLSSSFTRGALTAYFVLIYLLPLAVITCCYVGMAATLVRGAAGANSEALRARRRLALAVLALNATFAVCWLPTHAVYLVLAYAKHEVIVSIPLHVYGTLLEVGHVLGYVNSCLNPVFVFAISAMHSRPLVDFLLCRRCRRPPQPDEELAGSGRFARFVDKPSDSCSETASVDEG